MMRIYSLIMALVLCLGACSSGPPDQTSASPTSNAADDTALVDNAVTPADNGKALPEEVTKGVGAFVDPGDMDVDAWSTLEADVRAAWAMPRVLPGRQRDRIVTFG